MRRQLSVSVRNLSSRLIDEISGHALFLMSIFAGDFSVQRHSDVVDVVERRDKSVGVGQDVVDVIEHQGRPLSVTRTLSTR